MKKAARLSNAFSLVELTLALGVAGFCLLALLGLLPTGVRTNQASVQQTTANDVASQVVADLRAAARLPPGQMSKQFSLHPHNGGPWDPTPDWMYFSNDGKYLLNSNNQTTAPDNGAFRVDITYRFPPTDTTSLADITVSWPGAALNGVSSLTATDLKKAAGYVEVFAAINRQ